MTDFPEVKLKSLVIFPADVRAGTAIGIGKTSGIFTISTDFSTVQEVTNVTAEEVPVTRQLLWNSLTDTYSVVPFALSATAGVASLGGNTGALAIGEGIEFLGSTLSLIKASQAQAVAGTLNTAWMTPLRTRQAYDASERAATILTSVAGGVLGTGGDDTLTLGTWINDWKATSEVDAILAHRSYNATSLPNMLNVFSRFEGRGRPVINFTDTSATDNFFEISDNAQKRYDQIIRNVVLNGNTHVQNLFHGHNLSHAELSDLEAQNCQASGFFWEFGICNTLRNFKCSIINQPGHAWTVQPSAGAVFGSGLTTDTDHQCVGWNIERPIIEGVSSFGIGFVNALNMQINGGTVEGCGGGLTIKPGCNNNVINNLFCEANVVSGSPDPDIGTDIDNSGNGTVAVGGEYVSTYNAVLHKGLRAVMLGPRVRDITTHVDSHGHVLIGLKVLGTLTDNAPDTIRIGCHNDTTGDYYPDKLRKPLAHGLTLLNSWTAEGSGEATPAYYRDASGTIFLQGRLAPTGSAGTVIATLPVEARPADQHSFDIHNHSNNLVSIKIGTDGTITHTGSVAANFGLNLIKFLAAA